MKVITKPEEFGRRRHLWVSYGESHDGMFFFAKDTGYFLEVFLSCEDGKDYYVIKAFNSVDTISDHNDAHNLKMDDESFLFALEFTDKKLAFDAFMDIMKGEVSPFLDL